MSTAFAESELTSALDILRAPDETPQASAAVESPAPAETPVAEPVETPVEPDSENPFAEDDEPEQKIEPEPTPEKKADDDPPGDDVAPDEFLKTPRGKRIYDGYRYTRQLEKPHDQGGIGHRPSIEQIRQYFNHSQNLNALVDDLQSDDPARHDRVLNWMLGSQNPRAQVLEAKLVERITSNEQHVSAVTDRAIGNVLMHHWEAAQEAKTRGDQAQYDAARDRYNVLQEAYKSIFGKYRVFTEQGAPRDPSLDQERAALQQERTRIQQERDAQWTQTRNAAVDKRLVTLVNQALAPAASAKEKAPALYDRTTQAFAGEVVRMVQSEPVAASILRQAEAEARRTGKPDVFVKAFEQVAIPIMKGLKGKYIKEFGALVVQQNEAEHAGLRRSAAKAAPATAGAAVSRSVVPDMQRKDGESDADYYMRLLRE